ncbi:MerR family transcriptional regulator [Paraclostridium dentum]|uniref:MerR family transcriptional regulator n=1 Tax=Paraclostridium dentum TaxID=2662455 RepID=UPI003F377907
MTYHIKEISEITNVSQANIRYYEKEGLLPAFDRDKNNIRIFSEKDIELINLVKCLRTIGMPMKEIRKNVNLLIDKNSNLSTKDILLEHKIKLEDQIDLLKKYIDGINSKLDKNLNN